MSTKLKRQAEKTRRYIDTQKKKILNKKNSKTTKKKPVRKKRA